MNAPKSVEYREAVARIIDPDAWRGIDKFYESGGGRELYGSWERCLQHSANAPTSLAKADAILALSGPVSGMDTSSVAGVPCSQAGSHTGGLTLLERELLEALRAIVKPNGYDVGGKDGLNLERARAAIAKAEATATEAQHAGQWRPIESAPRDETEVLLLIDGVAHQGSHTGPSDGAIYARTRSIYNWFSTSSGSTHHDEGVTHWQPLPEAPPPAAPPSPAPPSSEREGSRAGDRS